jgi:SAM-dependent methyltransferase
MAMVHMSRDDLYAAVHRYYNDVQKEWDRLVQDPYHQIEFEIVHRIVTRRLAPGSRIIDVGSGPGRRALRLASDGHRLALTDISQRSLDRAVAEFNDNRLAGQLLSATREDARRLELPRGYYDAALVFGPAYHLLDEQDVRQCLERAAAGVSAGGHVFIIFLTRISVLKDLLKLGLLDDLRAVSAGSYPADGVYVASEAAANAYMPSARTFTLTEATALAQATGLEVLGAHSCEGVAAFLKPYVNALVPARTELGPLVDSLLPACGRPDVIEAGDHFLLTCRVSR